MLHWEIDTMLLYIALHCRGPKDGTCNTVLHNRTKQYVQYTLCGLCYAVLHLDFSLMEAIESDRKKEKIELRVES